MESWLNFWNNLVAACRKPCCPTSNVLYDGVKTSFLISFDKSLVSDKINVVISFTSMDQFQPLFYSIQAGFLRDQSFDAAN